MATTTLDFDGFASGTVIDDELAALGVTITAKGAVDRGGVNDIAMVFDTANVTGGDTDLAFGSQGGALIISEDGDSSDADDDAGGGIITFDFDDEVDVDGLTYLDGEEGGTIRAFAADGTLIDTVAIAPGVDNGIDVLTLGLSGVARLEVELNGSGAIDDLVFTSAAPPLVDESETGELEDGTDVTFEIEAPAEVTSDTSILTASLALGGGGASNNVAFVVDISGSTIVGFGGTPVGDVNGDFFQDTVLDAEIASLLNLSDAIDALGLDNDEVDIGLITFDTNADFVGIFESGSTDLAAALTGLQVAGSTNFAAALAETFEFFDGQGAENDTNIVYFLSDGFPNVGGAFTDEAAALVSQFDAQIIGIGVGSGSSLADLNLLDNTGGAEQVLSTDALDETVVMPGIDASIVDFTVTVNGIEQTDIDETDLIMTPFGFQLPDTEIGDLDATLGASNSVVAAIELSDGTEFELEATLIGAGFVIDDALI